MTYFENLNSLPILSKLIYQQNGVQFKYLLGKPDMHMYFKILSSGLFIFVLFPSLLFNLFYVLVMKSPPVRRPIGNFG